MKQAVHDFWNAAACGEALYLDGDDRESFRRQAEARYRIEPYIEPFARFPSVRGLEVLEIGVGLGADHQRFAEAGARLHGIDLTERAVAYTRRRLALFGLHSALRVADAEHLPYRDGRFDLVYSWGVLHHSPDPQRAIDEVWRVLRPGGVARIMIYHKWSVVGCMLWSRYALLRLRPLTPLAVIYARHLESPGTKAYSLRQARAMFQAFRDISLDTVLTHGDLLGSSAGQRHRGPLLTIARALWPRPLIRTLFRRNGLFLLIEALK